MRDWCIVKLNDKQAFIAAVDSRRLDAAAQAHLLSQSGDGGKLLHRSLARQYEQVFERAAARRK
jgi:hypothetical protein